MNAKTAAPTPLSANNSSVAPTLLSADKTVHRRRLLLFFIFLLALALRLLYLYEIRDQVFFRELLIDMASYDEWAQRIAAGDWLGSEVFYQDPLYPYFLALIYLVIGRSPPAVYVIQAVISAAAVFPLFGIGRRAFGDARVGLVAALLWALYKVDFFFVGQLLKTSPGIALVIFGLWLLYLFRDRPGLGTGLALGLVSGLALIFRGNFILVLPVLLVGAGLVVFRREGGRAKAALFALALSFLLVPLLTAFRNYHVTGEFNLTTAQAGINFYVGNFRENKWGVGLDPSWARRVPLFEQEDFANRARELSGRDFTPAELSRFWLIEGLKEIKAAPGLFLSRLGRKALLIVNWHEVPDNLSYDFFRQEHSLLLKLPLPGFWLAGPLGLAGLALALRRKKGGLLIAYVFLYSLTLLAFYIVDRYRLPLAPVLLVFAGYGLVAAFEEMRERRWRGPALFFAVMIAVGALGAPRFKPPDFAQSWFKVGNAHARQKSWSEAIEAFEKSLALNPAQPMAWINLGLCLGERNRWQEAARAFAFAVELAPDDAEARRFLGGALKKLGDEEGAEAQFKRARELMADQPKRD